MYAEMIAAVAFLFVAWYLLRAVVARISLSKTSRDHNCERPPIYPHRDPVLGTDLVSQIQKGMEDGNLMQVASRHFRSYGKTFEARMMGKTILYTMDSDNIHTILVLEFKKFGVEPTRRPASAKWMGRGIFVTDGQVWAHARKTLKPIFQKAQIGNLSSFEKHVSRMIKLIPRDGSTVDVQTLFQRLFIDTSTEYLFGQSTDSLVSASGSLEAESFIKSFDDALRGVSRQQMLNPMMKYFSNDRVYQSAISETHSQIDAYVDAALQRRKDALRDGKKVAPGSQSYVFVDQLVYETQDRNFLRDQLLNVFFPARDSSAIGASCVFFILARNPEVWKKLRKEVLALKQPITFEVLKSIDYLTWVLNECLRLLSPSNRAIRTCLADCILPRGGGANGTAPIFVSRGTQIDIDFGLMQKDQDLWGPDAAECHPERWEKLKPTWTYLPFLAGPRVCPAQQMVLTQYGYLLVRFAQEFERIDNRDDVFEFVEEHRMTKQSRNGVKVAFVPERQNLDGI